MNPKLPKIIEHYVEATNTNNMAAFLSCFAEDATVLDEGETLQGKKAIEAWFTKTKTKYNHTTEPVSINENGDELLLKSKVTGTFKGSPLVLDYRIKVKAGLIQDLRIA